MLAEGFIVAGSKEATWNAWNPGVAEPAFDRTNKRYVRRGALWEAMDLARETARPPVLLVDEIDKADADVPNALLEVLGNRSFTVRPLQNHVVNAGDGRLPLVIVTTNEERELPPAFVRRCVVLNLNPPRDDGAFLEWLLQRGRVHHHLRVAEAAQAHAAEQVLADRKEALTSGCSPVGLAEYIDLLTAIDELTREVPDEAREREQLNWVQRLGAYALVKHVDQDQSRRPLPLQMEPMAEPVSHAVTAVAGGEASPS
jgi:MoxR-like ATPase